jgi:hypothetical protein
LTGDIQALKEIGDRLDGKPKLEVDARVIRGIGDLTDDELDAIIASAEMTLPEDPVH